MATIRSMSSYEARRATFFEGLEESNKSRKQSLNVWPHPINLTEDALEDDMNGSGSSSLSTSSKAKQSNKFPTPSELANLGLYFDPNASEAPDSCILFPEGDVISGWKMGDDVPKRIREVVPNAALLKIHESKDASNQIDPKKDEWTWMDEDLLPTSKAMIAVRVKTFTSTWPYDGKKGWKPTSKKLSAAGFHYHPNEEEDDCAKCQYCDLVLGGWEKTDDPMHEHERRRPECPFFNCSLTTSPPEEVIANVVNPKSRSVSTATKRTRAVSKRKLNEDDDPQTEELANKVEEPKDKEVVENDAKEQTKSRAVSRSNKQATPVEDATAVVLIEAPTKKTTNRKASKKVQESDDIEMGSKTIIEKHVGNAEVHREIEEDRKDDDIKDIESEEKLSSEIDPPKTSTPVSIIQQIKTSSSDSKRARTDDEDEKEEKVDLAPTERSSLKRISDLVPFVISPLKKIRKLTSTEEDMTVEAWLKSQVTNACQEMEREGKERIEKLKQQIGKGRLEIEAVLRGKSINTTAEL